MQDITTREAFNAQLQGLDATEVNKLFFRPYSEKFYLQCGEHHPHALDVVLQEQGNYFVRKLEVEGTVVNVCLQRMAFTVGLMVGVSNNGQFYEWRYCYPSLKEAFEAHIKWDGTGHPPGEWIKRKGHGHDLRNPKLPPEFNEEDI